MADEFGGVDGPVAATSAVPFGAKSTANAPATVLACGAFATKVPSVCTVKTSMLLVRRSITTSTEPLGLNAMEDAAVRPVLRKRVEFGISIKCPEDSRRNPVTPLVPPALRT